MLPVTGPAERFGLSPQSTDARCARGDEPEADGLHVGPARPVAGRSLRSGGSRELLVDPAVRLRRLDTADERDLGREQLAGLREQLPLTGRELRRRSLPGDDALARRAVTDDLREPDRIAVAELRLRVSPS